MDKYFTIEVEVEEAEKKNYLGKLRDLFLKKGFVVEREWEDNIEISRPISSGKKNEIVMFPWIDRVYIQGKGGSVVVSCSAKYFIWFRYLILYFVPAIDIIFLLFLFLLVKERILLIPIALTMFMAFVVIYFVFNMQFKNMIKLLAEEIQNID